MCIPSGHYWGLVRAGGDNRYPSGLCMEVGGERRGGEDCKRADAMGGREARKRFRDVMVAVVVSTRVVSICPDGTRKLKIDICMAVAYVVPPSS